MKRKLIINYLLFAVCFLAGTIDLTETISADTPKEVPSNSSTPIKKVLIIGDSMTGWLGERLNAYGQKDGFQVATIVWDGSTIKKWGSSSKLASIIHEQNPDAVFICLGMNELFAPNPQAQLGTYLDHILKAVGNRDLLWIGPPSWPGKKGGEAMNSWLASRLGHERFFNSSSLSLARQSRTNPHPTKMAVAKWMDDIIDWIPAHTDLDFHSLASPGANEMSRGKVFIYKKMKENL